MKRYSYLFFDLDGTITDSCEGIYKSFEYALNHYGIKVNKYDDLKPILGPPLTHSFMNMFGFDEQKAEQAVKIYRERFSTIGLFENRLYDGAEEMLKALKQAGYKLVLATSKPLAFAERILKHFNIYDYFDGVFGASFDGKISTKEDVLQSIFDSMNICDRSKVLMIGDRKYDLAGAVDFGIDAMGVLYGYGSLDELKSYPSVYLAKDTQAVKNILLAGGELCREQ